MSATPSKSAPASTLFAVSDKTLERLISARVDVENFALVTHAVPAARVRVHIPDQFDLETFESDDGTEMCLVSASCFCNRRLRSSLLRYPAIDFDQNTFRSYVTHRGRRGTYFFGTHVSTRLSYLGQSLVAAHSYLAKFDVRIDKRATGYGSYSCSITSAKGVTEFELRATARPEAKKPFATGDELAQYITHRLHGYAHNPLGFETHGPISHRRMRPWSGDLISGRFDFWEDLGILMPDEVLPAYSVLVEPTVVFTLFPPRPAAGRARIQSTGA